jgi:hypothetical protein
MAKLYTSYDMLHVIPCINSFKFYISWVIGIIVQLRVFANVTMFAKLKFLILKSSFQKLSLLIFRAGSTGLRLWCWKSSLVKVVEPTLRGSSTGLKQWSSLLKMVELAQGAVQSNCHPRPLYSNSVEPAPRGGSIGVFAVSRSASPCSTVWLHCCSGGWTAS